MIVPSMESWIRRLHAQPIRLVLSLTGGGSRAIAELLEVPGGSQIMSEAVVPYSTAALTAWLGTVPEKFCDPRTARLMAMRAWEKGRTLEDSVAMGGQAAKLPGLIGVGCTASLASEPPKKGPHRVYVATQTLSTTTTASLTLLKGQRTRQAEEILVARLVLNQLAAACGLDDTLPLELLEGEEVMISRTDAPAEWQALLQGTVAAVRWKTAETADTPSIYPSNKDSNQVILPGAFNPLHAGHLKMAQVAEQMLHRPVAFEISMINVDKPPLDYTELSHRAEQFAHSTLWFTRAATFVEKAALFPGATFVVGVDTITRIADVRYYSNDFSRRDQALHQISQSGCRFLVCGRLQGEKFLTLVDLNLPADLRALCDEVPAALFREDISSTVLRRRQELPKIGS